MSTPLNIPDLPSTVSVTNQLARMVRIPGIRDIPANATVVIPFTGISEARRLRRWKNLKRAVAAGVLAYNAPNVLWGTLRIKNLTNVVQSFGGLILSLEPDEVRDVNLVDNMTVSRRIRIWKAIRNASAGSLITYEAVPSGVTPVVAGVTPNTGDAAGGDPVTIHGEGFVPGATVTIGGVAATSVVFVDDSTITCVTPAHAAGAAAVAVTNSVGHTGSLASGFTFV